MSGFVVFPSTSGMMKPLTVAVISNLLTALGNFAACELVMKGAGVKAGSRREDIAGYPAEFKEEFVKLSDLRRIYRHRIRIRLIDAKSPLGLYKSLLHSIRRYPAFIIEKMDVYCGWDRGRVEELLDTRMQALLA